MKRVLLIIGTRPEVIKMAPVYAELKTSKSILCEVCVTFQHKEMVQQTLDFFGINPRYKLNIRRQENSLPLLMSQILEELEKVLIDYRPDVVLVHGDTTTTLTASLSAFHHRIPVGHVEAGLRSQDATTPWPEEMNRKLIAEIAHLHFAPTERAYANLLSEGINPSLVWHTGNTIVDALQTTRENLTKSSSPFSNQHSLNRVIDREFALVTMHRRENIGEPIERICHGLLRLLAERPQLSIVFPIHLNTEVRTPVMRILIQSAMGETLKERIHLVEPLEYWEICYLLERASLVITDSGGLQEEAHILQKPILVLRATTERHEAITDGYAILVGADPQLLVSNALQLLSAQGNGIELNQYNAPYGDGRAAERVRCILESFLTIEQSERPQ